MMAGMFGRGLPRPCAKGGACRARRLTHVAVALCGLVVGTALDARVTLTSGALPEAAPRYVTIEIGLAIDKAHAGQITRKDRARRAANREAQEAGRRARASKRLTPVRKSEMPANCPYDSYASAAGPGDVYSCEGLQFHGVQDGKSTTFEGYAADVQPDEIQRARDIREKAIEQVEEATAREFKKELSDDCMFDAFASATNQADIYTCGRRSYKKSEKEGDPPFRVVKP